MDKLKLQVARQYARQAVFLAMRGKTVDADILIHSTAYNDSDVQSDYYMILSAICDGIDDYRDMQK